MKTLKQMIGSICTAWAFFIGASHAHAQDVDPRAVPIAQKLYEEGVELLDAKKFAAACPKLEQVARLIPKGIGGHEALGECYEGLGRLASAWGQYVQLAVLADAAGDKETLAKAHNNAERLRPKLATITIVVPKEMRSVLGLSVSWDGLVQEQGAWGTPIPVDAGKHRIEVKAPTRQTWTREVVVVADGASMEETVPVLKMASIEVKPRNGGVVQSTETSAMWMWPVGFVGLGVGFAGLGVGGLLGGLASSKFDASVIEGGCNTENACNARGVKLRQEAETLDAGSTGAFIVGGVLGATGLVLVVAAPNRNKDSVQKTSLHVDVGPSGIGLRGVW